MKNILKNNKGINLVSLSITIIILVIVSTILVYNAKDSLHVKSLTNMYTDIATLREKISDYYLVHGKIPAGVKYTNMTKIQELKDAGVLGANDDTDSFYVIDLEAIENLTLKYGRDYSKVSDNSDGAYDNFNDIYIINENSHNIFYVKGIEKHYTDDKNIDTAKVDLRYVEGIKIPEGYTYTGGNKNTGIVIKRDDNGEKYIWQVIEENLEEVPEGISVENEEEFLKSVNLYKGYYKQEDGTNVIYLKVV